MKHLVALIAVMLIAGCATTQARTPRKVRKAAKTSVQTGVTTPQKPIRKLGEVWPVSGQNYMISKKYGHCAFNIFDDEANITINDEEMIATVNEKTGEIQGRDAEGTLLFSGYLYRGGNLLVGQYRGKMVSFETACGA